MLRVNTKPRKRNAGRPAEKSAPQFLQWLRGRECAAAHLDDCEGKIEAAHVDHAGGKGVGTKVADRHAIPLCSRHHRLQHSRGWRTFEREYGILDAVVKASLYWRAWPARIAWERKNEPDTRPR